MIQVVDGADVGITADQSTARVLVDWPWAHLLAGQAQYELMLGVCWENLAEQGRLAPSQPQCAAAEGMAAMGRPCGQHPPVPQPRRLGARRPPARSLRTCRAAGPGLAADAGSCMATPRNTVSVEVIC